MGEAASYVKSRKAHTDAFIAVNECERTFTGICNSSGKNCQPYSGLITKVPGAIDYISADIYVVNEGWEPNAVRDVYEGLVYKALAPHQKTWVVPGLFADSRLPHNESEAIMLGKLNGYWDWMQNDTNVVGMNPWHWNTWGSSMDKEPQFKLGAWEFPKLRARLSEIGQIIKGDGYGRRGRKMPPSPF